ncbi:MAG TPA: efflux RND transporter periplasmic adaptor subunit [Candidatus Krumholzibacteria bacterium]|nr:efflux RND transporter periplasmic adaptor subunit [Candidatus Krumholzibacteria bacterium]
MIPNPRPAAVFLLVMITASLAALGGCGGKEAGTSAAPLEVGVVAAIQKDVPIYREWVGQTYGGQDVEIRARTSGWLQHIHFTEGGAVQKGQLLYTIDPSELQEQHNSAMAHRAEVLTMLTQAEADVKRYRPLAEAGAVSQRTLEIAEATLGARRSELDAAEASVRYAKINLGYASIESPITGLIGLSLAKPGEFVGQYPNPVILNTVSSVDTVRVRFAISEREYLELVQRGTPREDADQASRRPLDLILADGSTYPHQGWVSVAQREVDSATGTLTIEAYFPNPEHALRPGQFGRVRTAVEVRAGAVVIPSRAVLDLQGIKMAYVVGADNKAQNRRVTIGATVGNEVVVDEGIAAGERVIVDGLVRVRPDMVVAPREGAAQPAEDAEPAH